MIKYGSIEQFKNVIKSVRDFSAKYGKEVPTLEFIGTVKLHGTNASVVFDHEGNIEAFQSRERVLTITSDNAGFCMWGERNKDELDNLFDSFKSNNSLKSGQKLVMFGEWCGPGVQKGVAISQIPEKIFVVFNITIVDPDGNKIELFPEEIQNICKACNLVSCVYEFETYKVTIDFNQPQMIQNKLVELTLAVEEECPVGKHFGVTGVGEGIVYWNPELNLSFKVKGEKHSVSKVRTIKEIAAVDIERMESTKQFVDTVITENRLNQGLAKLGEMGLEIDVKNTSTFMKWVVSDGIREEHDVIVASNFDIKEIGKIASDVAKKFWFEQLSKVN